MKKILLVISAVLVSFLAEAGVTDTLQVFMDGGNLRVEVTDVEELEEISEHDLNAIVDEVIETSMAMQDSLDTNTTSNVEYELDVNKKEEPKSFMQKRRKELFLAMRTNDSDSVKEYFYLSTGHPAPDENCRSINFMEIRFGFNNYLENGSFPSANSNHSLGTFASRSFSIAFNTKTRIFKKQSPLFVKYGLDFNFNNYKLENNVRIIEGDNNIEFVKDEVNNYTKSKLATIYLDVPVMFLLDFKNKKTEKRDFLIGVGAYAGYRMRSITKHKYSDIDGDDQKDKNKGSFYLNNFRYGIQAMIGFRNINFFARYQMNELFESHENTPQLNVVDFGIVLAVF